MMSIIKQVYIKNFKSLRNHSIPLNQLTILAGVNSVGKSSVIQSILLARIAFENSALTQKIAINGDYLLQLGFNRNITQSNRISFEFRLEDETICKVDFKVNPNESYLELQQNQLTALFAPNFHYLNAERIGPRPAYISKITKLPSTGYQGELTIELLSNGQLWDLPALKNFHKCLSIEGESEDNLLKQTDLWMNFVIPGIEISANKLREVNQSVALYNNHTAPNVGFGISYLLPIIVTGLIAQAGEMFLVENPEAHLHPYGQSQIGYFLAMIAASGVQVLIETHSEHVISGIRKATARNTIEANRIQINFLKKEADDVVIVPITVNTFSDLSQYPKGFFDQSQQDAKEMIEIKKKKRKG